MIYHIKGHIVRKSWGPKDCPDTIQGTLCYMSAESDANARLQVAEKYPDFNIDTVELITEDQIMLLLTKQNTMPQMVTK